MALFVKKSELEMLVGENIVSCNSGNRSIEISYGNGVLEDTQNVEAAYAILEQVIRREDVGELWLRINGTARLERDVASVVDVAGLVWARAVREEFGWVEPHSIECVKMLILLIQLLVKGKIEMEERDAEQDFVSLWAEYMNAHVTFSVRFPTGMLKLKQEAFRLR